jgi:Transglycosylase SLT domain
MRGALFSGTVLAIAVLLGLPMVARAAPDRHPPAVAAPAAAAPAVAQQTAGTPAGRPIFDLGKLVIRPLPISTGQPGQSTDVVFGPAGDVGELGIPTMVLHAYQLAAAELAAEQPSCHLPWWLLAGIGHTESGHAESGRLYADGTTRGRILGPVLDGTLADNAIITDTDHGRYDGDPNYDRAVGPMQFIPSTWMHWAADGNHDGKRDPNNVFDATLAAGRYLCADGRNLATLPGLTAAVLAYNHSQPYLATVLAWGLAYRNGASAIADLVAPVISDVTQVRPPLTARPPKKPVKIAAPASAAPASASPAGSSSSGGSSSSASASPTASCTSSAPASSAASSPAVSGSGDAHSASGQPVSPASSADGGSATVTATGSTNATDPASSAATAASNSTAASDPAPSDTASCTP